MFHRALRYRLYPTPEQETRLCEWAGTARYVYNLALEQRRDWWRQYRANTGRAMSFASQSREVTELRAASDWLRAAPRSIFEYALRDLDRAFSRFFHGSGFPAFRTKERHITFTVQGCLVGWRRLNAKWGVVRLPKGLTCKFRMTRAVSGKVNSASIQRVAGTWFVSFAVERNASAAVNDSAVGIDRGVANTITLSDGEARSIPASVAASASARKRAQRILFRRKKGSARRLRQQARVARKYAHEAASRRNWLHAQTTDIANRFGIVAIEALATARMTKGGGGASKRGLNRLILEQGWAKFATMLKYKLAERGGTLHYVNPAYTSQTCSSCGSVDARSRKSQATFECVDCGHRAHADVNAAINILRRSPAGVEGAGYGPVEARPGEMLTHLENLAA